MLDLHLCFSSRALAVDQTVSAGNGVIPLAVARASRNVEGGVGSISRMLKYSVLETQFSIDTLRLAVLQLFCERVTADPESKPETRRATARGRR